MRGLVSWLTAVTVAFSLLSAGAPTARAAPGDPVYVSLGDSLSVGYQPGRGRTDHGYVDDLWRRARGIIPTLRVRKFGCPGETSKSMISGVGSPCSYGAGSQLAAAVGYLANHSEDVEFVTIDIGVNDVVDRCFDFSTGVLHRGCVVDLRPRLRHRLMRIIDDVRAVTDPEVPILAMTYYNPFLGLWGSVPHGKGLAKIAARAWRPFNDGLRRAYRDAGAVVANVAATFRVNDFWHTVILPGRGPVPLNVARTCRWTWFCSRRFFGDPHANATGYRKIGRTFYRELRPILS
jgi:lysophospholipase L1-like esterase